jgi:SAM-dependent methyltransferase
LVAGAGRDPWKLGEVIQTRGRAAVESSGKGEAMGWQAEYMNRYYGLDRGFIDGTSEFHALCASQCRPGGRILEIGAGPTNETSKFLATLGELHGVDLDPDVTTNTALVKATTITGEQYPYEGSSFDICVSNFVCEHIGDPIAHLREVGRVLKLGGTYVFRTPNRYHYVSAVASATPHWFHRAVANRVRNLPAEAHDPYPTFHRLNSKRAIGECSRRAGLNLATIRFVEKEPSYGMFARPAFLAMMAYERIVNAIPTLEWLRANLFVVLQKPARD